VAPRSPQRHVVVNTLVTDWNDHDATATSDVLFLFLRDGAWAIHMVGRYHDTLHRDGDAWRFRHRAITWLTQAHSRDHGITADSAGTA
jgi:SnoaL-like domain